MSLIPADNIWLLWVVVFAMAAFAIYAEQHWKWAGVVSAAVVAILGSLILVNIHVVPSKSDVYTTVTSYILPLSIPLLLFKCNLKKIIQESGKMFLIVNVAIVGTMIVALIIGIVLRTVPGIQAIIAMQVGGFCGGTVNMMAMAKVYNADAGVIQAAAITGNLLCVAILIFYSYLGSTKWAKKNYPHPHIEAFEANAETGKSLSEQYWKPKPISLRDIAFTMASGVAITGISQYISQLIGTTALGPNLKMVIGNPYLIMTTITVILVTIFPNYFNNLAGAEEIGSFMILMFFVALGLTADFATFINSGPVLIVSGIILALSNFGIVLGVGKLLKWNIEEIISCSNATVGGPTSAAALAINKGWKNLVVPSLLVGLYGYAVANYSGVIVASILANFLPK